MSFPGLRVRNLKIDPPLLLAPMAGLTHSALRTVIKGYGGVGLLSTEMLAARTVPTENPHVSPWLVRTDIEHPLSYQLLVTCPEEVMPAVEALHRFGADAIDLNLGCPAPRVRKAGGGSILATRQDTISRIIGMARKMTELPLTAKIRLGESLDVQKLRDFCLMLEGEGIDMVTVHARLRSEGFHRKPRWEWVGYVKQWLKIPVIANGSICSADDARACLRASGADGLMIGRAAAEKPWIFGSIAREVYDADIPAREIILPAVYRQVFNNLNSRFRPERRLGRLKEFTHYFARNYPFGHHLASAVQSSSTVEEAWERAVLFFAGTDPDGWAVAR
ncbi:MAG: tRNA-dihydrouridine synthase family protein [Desulfobulbaceae bacterium]|nr:tRNA-dihydrouridine synthase family protein [Desulfobulbaceae bacterium]